MGAIYDHEKVKKNRGNIEVYSFSLLITFTGPDGKPKNKRSEGIGIAMPNRIKEIPGLSKRERFKLVVRDEIRQKIYGLLSESFDLISPGKAVKGGFMTKKQAEKMMKQIRSGRNTRFKLIIFRQGV